MSNSLSADLCAGVNDLMNAYCSSLPLQQRSASAVSYHPWGLLPGLHGVLYCAIDNQRLDPPSYLC